MKRLTFEGSPVTVKLQGLLQKTSHIDVLDIHSISQAHLTCLDFVDVARIMQKPQDYKRDSRPGFSD